MGHGSLLVMKSFLATPRVRISERLACVSSWTASATAIANSLYGQHQCLIPSVCLFGLKLVPSRFSYSWCGRAVCGKKSRKNICTLLPKFLCALSGPVTSLFTVSNDWVRLVCSYKALAIELSSIDIQRSFWSQPLACIGKATFVLVKTKQKRFSDLRTREHWLILYNHFCLKGCILLGLQSIPWEARDKDTAAMLVEQTI